MMKEKKSAGKPKARGRVTVVGIGPGSTEHMTRKAMDAIRSADTILGLTDYVREIRNVIPPSTKVHSSHMGHEIERVTLALKLASKGKKVVIVSGGDPGVYGMAGAILETARRLDSAVDVKIVPGVTAATAAAARLGAPLMADFAVISLSDLLVPRKKILERVEKAAKGDFVLVLYNPQSRTRKEPLKLAHRILTRYRKPTTPVGIVTAYARREERIVLTTLKRMLDHKIDMRSTIVVGNSSTVTFNGKMLTPRGYYRSPADCPSKSRKASGFSESSGI
jgi:precorrin-3B C17-methyltransferase